MDSQEANGKAWAYFLSAAMQTMYWMTGAVEDSATK